MILRTRIRIRGGPDRIRKLYKRLRRSAFTRAGDRNKKLLPRTPSLSSSPPHPVTQHGLLAQLDLKTFSEDELRNKFNDLDTNKDGLLSREELSAFFKEGGETVVANWDDDRDGFVSSVFGLCVCVFGTP